MKIGCSLRLFCSSSGRPTCSRMQWLQPWDLLLPSSYLGADAVLFPEYYPMHYDADRRRRRRLHRRLQRQQRLHLGALHLQGGNWVTYVPRLTTGRQLVRVGSDRAGAVS